MHLLYPFTPLRLRVPKGPPLAINPSPEADDAEKLALRAAGYKVEDMGVEYGAAFNGRFRWINIRRGDFQEESEMTPTADGAWAAAKADYQKARIS